MLLFRHLHRRLPTSLSVLLLLMGTPMLAAAQGNNGIDWVPFDLDQFSGNVTLDTDGDVQLFWKVGDEYSTFGIASRSEGYLALGFSETGAMTGADMAVGYMEDGKFVLENRHAAGFVSPELSDDQENNIRLKEGSQSDGVTAFIFEKKNIADCLETQVTVATESWQWFIYAFSENNEFAQHADSNKGKKYVKLGTGETVSVNEARDISNTSNFTLTQPEVSIPTQETTYCYSLHKMPSGKKNYLLGEQPSKSSDLLHHLVIYACYGPPDEYMDMLDADEANCDYDNFSNPCNGFVSEWAPGMSGRTFESGFGKPFGEDYYEYVMLETHYNNPDGIEGEKSAASYTFLYNDEPVDTEIGTLTLGDLKVDGWFLEPGQELTARQTVCTPECTDNWPKEGITAVSVFHHMHARGRNARVQIIRDGKEIEPLSTLRDFEYGYQFSKSLDSVKLLPGDKIITTCEYDTSNDSEPVAGGLSSQEEMCFAWVDYYPANSVLACTQAQVSKSSTNGTMGLCLLSDEVDSDVFPSDFLTSSYTNLTETGNMCSASNSTEDTSDSEDENSSNNSSGSDEGDSGASSAVLFSSGLLAMMLALSVFLS